MRRWQNRDWAAVWLDQQKALIMRPDGHDDEYQVLEINSDVEAKHRSTGGRGKSQPFMHENGPFSAKHVERARAQRLEMYFDEILGQLEGVQDLLILGRGPCSVAFSKKCKASNQGKVDFIKSERLTPQELKNRTFEYFGWVIPRRPVLAPGQPICVWRGEFL